MTLPTKLFRTLITGIGTGIAIGVATTLASSAILLRVALVIIIGSATIGSLTIWIKRVG